MTGLALKMLIGNKTTFFGVIFGIFLATLLISQQSAIFLGLLSRSYRMVTDIPAPNMWVMDEATESDDKVRLMSSSNLDLVRSTPNVLWAVPLYKSRLPLVTEAKNYEICQLFGIDEASLIGAPKKMLEGKVENLRREGGVIIDHYSATKILSKTLPDGSVVPLKVGDELEINQHRALVVGICDITQGFYPQPILFTSAGSFQRFHSDSAPGISFILVKTAKGFNPEEVRDVIDKYPNIKAYSSEEFKVKIMESFLRTGILINFGLSVALAIIIGFSIAGQLFYQMTLENLKYYALIKAVGGNQAMITLMVIEQVLLVGGIGFCLGITATILWGMAVKGTTLAYLFPWQLLISTAVVILLICIFTALMSLRKIAKTDPQLLMGN